MSKPESTEADFRPYIISRCMADVEAREIDWEWRGKIPAKRLTVVAGDGGVGKSFLTVAIAAAVSTGAPWPDQPGVTREPSSVVLLNAEDDPEDTIKKRLIAAGADCERIHILDTVVRHEESAGEFFNLLHDLALLEGMIMDTRATLCVIDPIGAYLGGTDTHKDGAVRSALGPLAALAARTSRAIITVMHLNKGTTPKVSARVSGSVAFTSAARMAWIVAEHPEIEARRVFLPYKFNIVEHATGLAFEITDGRVCWIPGVCDVDPDDVVSLGKADKSAVAEAQDWLIEYLALGPVEVSAVQKASSAAGHAPRTLQRAKKSLKVKSTRNGYGADGQWAWKLPDSAIKDSQAPESVPDLRLRVPSVKDSKGCQPP